MIKYILLNPSGQIIVYYATREEKVYFVSVKFDDIYTDPITIADCWLPRLGQYCAGNSHLGCS